MSLRPLAALTLLGAFCSFVPFVARAQAASEPAAAPAEVRAWLLRIHEAAGKRNFQGTFVVSGGGTVSSARIAHFYEGRHQFERIETLDGQARHVFRHDDLVHTVWPDNRVAVVEQSQLLMSFPALLQAGDDRIVDHYDVRPQGADRVAGHDANVLLVRPKDTLRFGYRLWAEKISGLLLRADVLGDRGDVLETSAFSEVTIGIRPQPETVLRPMKRLDGYRIVRPVLTQTKLESEGWALRETAPGFRLVSCVRRPIEGAGGEADADGPPVLQAIYADGLSYVSIFIEPYNPQRHTRQMMASVGATQTLMRRQGDWWITAVGEVPMSTLKMFAKGLERQR